MSSIQALNFSDNKLNTPKRVPSEDEVDVVWDWNSPKSKSRNIRKHKTAEFVGHSPKPFLKRHASHNTIPSFNHIKEELESLENEFVENKVKSAKEDDWFSDDSFEELVRFSQIENTNKDKLNDKLERTVTQAHNFDHKETYKEDRVKIQCDKRDISLNVASDPFEDEDDELLSQAVDNVIKNVCSSPPLLPISYNETKENLETDKSPFKCSPEEIEHKRQQALERLKQKKTQEMIENKRLEALKRLQANRYKCIIKKY